MNTYEVQQALVKAGYPVVVDGINGPQTKAAVKSFQIANGLTPDGIAGPQTQEALKAASGEGSDHVERDEGAAVQQPAGGGGPPWPKQKDCMTFYGAVGMHQTTLKLPFPMKLAWDLDTIVNSFSVHEKVHDSAARVFQRIADVYDAAAREEIGLNIFGGCLNVRKMTGGSSYSMHSWGIAIDFDPERNQYSWGADKARLAQPDANHFWRLWEQEGWVSLGRARNYDWMHVQAARL